MVDRRDVPAGAHNRQDAFELLPHGVLAPGHDHFVVTAQHQEAWIAAPDLDDIHAGLTLQWVDAFQPGFEQNAVLAGRFSGTWTEADLRMLLGDIGITVQSTLDQSTSILIVGEPLYTDPDTDEALEDPIPVSELEVYKTAESKGVQIVHIGDLRRFFKK